MPLLLLVEQPQSTLLVLLTTSLNAPFDMRNSTTLFLQLICLFVVNYITCIALTGLGVMFNLPSQSVTLSAGEFVIHHWKFNHLHPLGILSSMLMRILLSHHHDHLLLLQ
jgi:hypothetical protein